MKEKLKMFANERSIMMMQGFDDDMMWTAQNSFNNSAVDQNNLVSFSFDRIHHISPPLNYHV